MKLYELLAGKLPFEAVTVANAMYVITNFKLVPALDVGISAALAVVLDKCFHRDIDHRYQSAEEVLDALKTARLADGL